QCPVYLNHKYLCRWKVKFYCIIARYLQNCENMSYLGFSSYLFPKSLLGGRPLLASWWCKCRALPPT
ncbi:hypothetical protein L9F63_008932, partial [Diploptera punctata]